MGMLWLFGLEATGTEVETDTGVDGVNGAGALGAGAAAAASSEALLKLNVRSLRYSPYDGYAAAAFSVSKALGDADAMSVANNGVSTEISCGAVAGDGTSSSTVAFFGLTGSLSSWSIMVTLRRSLSLAFAAR